MSMRLQGLRWRRAADRSGPKQLLALELGRSETKAVVLSRCQNAIRWERTERLPRYDAATRGAELADALKHMKHQAEYASVVSLLERTLLRLVSFPGQPGQAEVLQHQVKQTLGVDDSYAVQLEVVTHRATGDKAEYSVLASAMPMDTVEALDNFVESVGLRPVSLVAGAVALANLVHAVPGAVADDTATGFLHVSRDFSDLLLFRGQELALVRQFQFSEMSIVSALMRKMRLDQETAEKLYQSGSFDISGDIVPSLGPWLHQIVISLDFCERRYGQTVGTLYLLGEGTGWAMLEPLIAAKVARPVVVWNPLDTLTGVELMPKARSDAAGCLLPFCEAFRFVGGRNSHEV